MSAPELRRYRVSLMGHGTYAVWVTAESRQAARDLAERMWSTERPAIVSPGGGLEYVEILDEYDEGGAL